MRGLRADGAWQDMTDFVHDEVTDPVARARLQNALGDRGAFRRFKAVLRDYSDLRRGVVRISRRGRSISCMATAS